MSKFIVILLASFSATFLITPMMRKIASMTNIVDNPDNELKIHKRPISYLGGIAIFMGMFISLLVANALFEFCQRLFWGLLLASFLITLLGLIDDLSDIKQNYKFIAQVLIASFLVFLGFRLETFPVLLLAIPLTIFYVIGGCNAINLLDGLDGLATGITIIAAFFFSILFFVNNNDFGMILSLSLLGACIAFLIYNFNPASIFMGDSGSMFVGLVLSVLMITYSGKAFDFKSFLAGILICGVPIFDTALTFMRRYLNKRPIFPGDRSHFYDQLIDRGFSIKKTVFTAYSIGLIFGATALIIEKVSQIVAFLIFLLILSILTALIIKMNMHRMS